MADKEIQTSRVRPTAMGLNVDGKLYFDGIHTLPAEEAGVKVGLGEAEYIGQEKEVHDAVLAGRPVEAPPQRIHVIEHETRSERAAAEKAAAPAPADADAGTGTSTSTGTSAGTGSTSAKADVDAKPSGKRAGH